MNNLSIIVKASVAICCILISSCSTTPKEPRIAPQYDIVDTEKGSAPTFPNQHWQKVLSPEKMGWNTKKLDSLVGWASLSGSAAGVVVHKGRIITTWGDITHKYKCHSIRKTFLEALYGIYHEKGEINLDATMAELGIDDIDPLSDSEKKATVRQLLQGRSGIYHEAAYETSSMALNRPSREAYDPGKNYYYNNWDFNTQLAIFEQVTGKKIFDEFKASIADPLQMEYYLPTDGKYYFEREYSKHPAYPFRMTALDMARVGLLYQNKGRWKDKQLISPEWVKEATTSYSNNRGYGVGYKWKISRGDLLAKYGTYFTTGRGGHRIFVVPDLELVFVNRVDTDGSDHMSSFQTEGVLRRIIKAVPK